MKVGFVQTVVIGVEHQSLVVAAEEVPDDGLRDTGSNHDRFRSLGAPEQTNALSARRLVDRLLHIHRVEEFPLLEDTPNYRVEILRNTLIRRQQNPFGVVVIEVGINKILALRVPVLPVEFRDIPDDLLVPDGLG